jgi:hypothetical protein
VAAAAVAHCARPDDISRRERPGLTPPGSG